MKMKARIDWRDGWIGFFWEPSIRKLYICPLPFVVFSFDFDAPRPEPVAAPIPTPVAVPIPLPPRKKYMLHGGFITSKMDGDRHFISATRLAQLYNLNVRECVLDDDTRNRDGRGIRGYVLSDFIHLYPRFDGDYEVFSSFINTPPEHR